MQDTDVKSHKGSKGAHRHIRLNTIIKPDFVTRGLGHNVPCNPPLFGHPRVRIRRLDLISRRYFPKRQDVSSTSVSVTLADW